MQSVTSEMVSPKRLRFADEEPGTEMTEFEAPRNLLTIKETMQQHELDV